MDAADALKDLDLKPYVNYESVKEWLLPSVLGSVITGSAYWYYKQRFNRNAEAQHMKPQTLTTEIRFHSQPLEIAEKQKEPIAVPSTSGVKTHRSPGEKTKGDPRQNCIATVASMELCKTDKEVHSILKADVKKASSLTETKHVENTKKHHSHGDLPENLNPGLQLRPTHSKDLSGGDKSVVKPKTERGFVKKKAQQFGSVSKKPTQKDSTHRKVTETPVEEGEKLQALCKEKLIKTAEEDKMVHELAEKHQHSATTESENLQYAQKLQHLAGERFRVAANDGYLTITKRVFPGSVTRVNIHN